MGCLNSSRDEEIDKICWKGEGVVLVARREWNLMKVSRWDWAACVRFLWLDKEESFE